MDEVVWHEGYPPPVGQPGPIKRWLSKRTVEKRALCPFHEQWEAVWRWRWTDVPPEYRAGWPWLRQMEGCGRWRRTPSWVARSSA